MRVLYLGLLMMGLLGIGGEGQTALWVVAIDAGHGGDDTGGIGVDNLIEKEIVLQIAHLIALEASGLPNIRIILTRSDDRYRSPVERIAHAQGAHFFISLHLDFSYNPWMRGIRAIVPTHPTSSTKALAEVLCRRIVTATKGPAWETKTAPLWLRRLSVPAVQLNLGFITNPEEARKLGQLAYQKRLAQAIVEGISEFVSNSPK